MRPAAFTRRLAVCALAILGASAAHGQGRLAFDQERHAFGEMAEGERATHTFRFTNAGTAPLTLVDVRASCGCTTPTYTTTPVAPGGAGEVTVVFDSGGRPGPFEKTVSVSADGAAPVTLRITGDVRAAFAADGVRQGSLMFESDVLDAPVSLGGPVQRAFRFQNVGGRPVRIRSVTTRPAGLDVVFADRPVFGGDVGAVLVTVPDPAVLLRDGELDVAVVVETDDADGPIKSLRLRGRPAE